MPVISFIIAWRKSRPLAFFNCENQTDMKMKDLCTDERPREKIIHKGVSSLSNAELLAVLIRTGTSRMNAVDVARVLLKNASEKLGEIAAMSVAGISNTHGIGQDKAATITAAFELGRRCAQEQAYDKEQQLNSSYTVYKLMSPQMRNLKKEECWMLLLNRNNKLISKELVSIGSIDATCIDHMEVAKRCLEKHASGVILVHNHPSGSSYPSSADMNVTELIRNTLESCGIRLLDHVILASDNWYSFADESINNKKFCKGEK